MKKSDAISDILALYSFFLSGTIFSGFLNYGKNTLVSYAFVCIGFAALCLPVFLCEKTKPDFSVTEKSELFFAIPLTLCCISLFCIYSKNLCNTMPSLSDGFSQKWFSVFFVIVCLLAVCFSGMGKRTVFKSICLLLLPAVISPALLSWFNFLGYKAPDVSVFSQSISMDRDYLFKGLSLAAQIPLLCIVPDTQKQKKPLRFIIAVILFFITVFLESAKHILYFGTHGANLVANPAKTMLSSLPYLDLREIYVFAFYFSYMIKTTLCFYAACVLAKRISDICVSESVEKRKISFTVFFVFSLFFIGFSMLPEDMIPVFFTDAIFGIISAILIISGIIFNLVSKRKNSRQKMHLKT